MVKVIFWTTGTDYRLHCQYYVSGTDTMSLPSMGILGICFLFYRDRRKENKQVKSIPTSEAFCKELMTWLPSHFWPVSHIPFVPTPRVTLLFATCVLYLKSRQTTFSLNELFILNIPREAWNSKTPSETMRGTERGGSLFAELPRE